MNYSMPLLHNEGNKEVDCIILTVPWVESSMALMAPAVLKPIVEAAGYSCLGIDLSVNIREFVNEHPLRDDFIKFFFNEEYDYLETLDTMSELFETIADDIVSWNPSIVCLSLFSYISQPSAKWLAYLIKQRNPNTVIIIGGAGCLDTFVGESDFRKFMLDTKLADFHIRGDAEQSLYELLIGNNTYNGINDSTWKELPREQLGTLPTPDYSDYNFDSYSLKALPIIGSRGCVRKCQYCDYIENWKIFAWRDADNIFEEMLLQANKYGIRRFKFQDSLTNGNVTEFTKLMEMMATYNENNPDNPLSWGGYYVFRNVNKKTDYEWDLLKKSGVKLLTVGIENLNQDIRFLVGKKFTNEAIDYHLEKALELDINMVFLNIVGYYNETQKHIDFIKNWLRTHTKYKDIMTLGWGAGLGIFPHTYLDRNKTDLGIVMHGEPFRWTSSKINSTPAIRAKWVIELSTLSKELGYEVSDFEDNHFLIEVLLRDEK